MYVMLCTSSIYGQLVPSTVLPGYSTTVAHLYRMRLFQWNVCAHSEDVVQLLAIIVNKSFSFVVDVNHLFTAC